MLGCTSLPKCVHTGPGPTPDYARWAVVPRSPTLKAHRRSLKDPSHRSTPAAPGPRRRLGAVLAVVSFPVHFTSRRGRHVASAGAPSRLHCTPYRLILHGSEERLMIQMLYGRSCGNKIQSLYTVSSLLDKTSGK